MGFVSSIFGATNTAQAPGATNLQTSNYGNGITQAMNAAGQPINQNLVNNTQSNQVNAQQAQLAQMLQQQAAGTGGPSPIQNQLTQATNQNINSSAAQLAGVRGMNPATAARLILQNGANQNQQAANQAGQLQANQQLNAQNQLSGLLSNQRSQDLSQSQGETQAGLQGQANQTSLLGTLGGLQNQQNAGQIQNALGSQQLAAGIAGGNAQTNAGIAGGLIGAGASALGGASSSGGGGGGGGMSKGGVVGYDDGGMVEGDPTDFIDPGVDQSTPGVGAMNGVDAGTQVVQQVPQAPNNPFSQMSGAAPMVPQYGYNPTPYGSGNGIGKGLGAGAAAVGKMLPMLALLQAGGKVQGDANVSGDSPQNDTVPAMLSPGEVVIPRSKAQNPEKAKEFMQALQKHHGEANGPQGYAKVLAAHRNLHARLQELEHLAYGGMCG